MNIQGHKHHPKRLLAEQKRQDALKYRLQGYTYKEIGKLLGCRFQTVYRWVVEATEARQAEMTDLVREHTQMQCDRIYHLIRALWPKASQGDTDAVIAMLRCDERLSRLLGLDAPAKVQTEIELRTMPRDELVSIAQRVGLSVVMMPEGQGAVPLALGSVAVAACALPEPPEPDLPVSY